MKIPLLTTALLALSVFPCAVFAADLTPSDPQTPLFQIFAPLPVPSDHPKVTWDDTKPLLTVSVVHDLQLAKDKKGVLIGMNEEDTRTFAALTHQHANGLLILKAGDDLIEVLHITAPIEDGYIGFRHPQEDDLATYLRKRFKIGEFRETPKMP